MTLPATHRDSTKQRPPLVRRHRAGRVRAFVRAKIDPWRAWLSSCAYDGVDCWMQIVQEGDLRVVRIAGRLTSAQVPDLLAACCQATCSVRVDLSDLLLADPIAIDALRRVRVAGAEMVGLPRYMLAELDSQPRSECKPILVVNDSSDVRDLERKLLKYRGYDVVDLEKIGFVSTGPRAVAEGFRFETGLRGNNNGGHRYGTDLGEPDKRALLEYLKTR